jgi:hypothetical protein
MLGDRLVFVGRSDSITALRGKRIIVIHGTPEGNVYKVCFPSLPIPISLRSLPNLVIVIIERLLPRQLLSILCGISSGIFF